MRSGPDQIWEESSYVGRTYGRSLRDNFNSCRPTHTDRFADLKREYAEAMRKPHPEFSEFLYIEAGLVDTMPDEMILARFWAINDRFRRVVPLETRKTYLDSIPPKDDVRWQGADFLREQTKTLLDIIHSNYLMNIAREKSIKRLKLFIWVSFAVASSMLAITYDHIREPAFKGMTVLVALGMFGALLSISNRLQQAVSRDALTEDGVYELTGLRIGWVGILMSLFTGGGFALVIYWVVMANLLGSMLPETIASARSPVTQGSTANSTGVAKPRPEASTGTGGGTDAGKSTPARSDSKVETPAAPIVPVGNDAARAAPAPLTAVSTPTPSTKPPVDPNGAGAKAADESTTTYVASDCRARGLNDKAFCRTAIGLGLFDQPSFFRMLILALLAGFAERLVPDILSRLSKQSSSN
ncbi:hypothetical protein KX816_18950 [Sphingosinicellaceae bacterium]|nr:hypothetical protein KX816_18950 [Sphingosinicellaceae bacterium]